MATTFRELKRRVFIGFPRTDGEAVLAVEQSINDVIKLISSLEDISSQLLIDTTSAATVISQKTYHISDDFVLIRCKDIHSMRLIDSSNSIKLQYVPHSDIDRIRPYPESDTTGRPIWYTTFGDYIELFPIPDAVYNITIRYSQWPDVLDSETDQSPYSYEWDHVIVFLAKDLANAYLNGSYYSAADRAYQFLSTARRSSKNPDSLLFANPFTQWHRKP